MNADSEKKDYYVYVLLCKNGTYYTGITTDLERRYQEHLKGIGSKYTRSFPPQEILASWKIGPNLSTALQFEKQIKKLKRADKEKLILNQLL